ncbi:hypothetical protein BCR43DRAFT_519042 [Syncephalastrum racemosum]|uniref:DUF4939 domain-containing protein n=1 Tax=Syncephalastrum racemosum TaxID=13706 RepID=A0A1X2H0F0_SYNRA|nr:hypothetical protein BCR43DRAFT_519042 [Syncephalastrum racemosum]
MSSKNLTDQQQKEFIIQEFVLQALPSNLHGTYKKTTQYFHIPEEQRAKFTEANLAYLQEKAQELATSFQETVASKKQRLTMTSSNNVELLTTMQQMLLQMQHHVTEGIRNLSIESHDDGDTDVRAHIGHGRSRSLRINDPAPFSGKAEDVRTFVTQVKVAIRMNQWQFEDDLAKICYMFSFMTGIAYDWVQPLLENIASDDMDVCLTSFPLFLEEFHTTFGETNELGV